MADSFYGVYSGQAALQVTPDKIMYIDSEIISQAQVYNYETKKTGAVYDKDKLTGYDPYDFFLSGPSALLRIENPKAAEKKNLIVFWAFHIQSDFLYSIPQQYSGCRSSLYSAKKTGRIN